MAATWATQNQETACRQNMKVLYGIVVLICCGTVSVPHQPNMLLYGDDFSWCPNPSCRERLVVSSTLVVRTPGFAKISEVNGWFQLIPLVFMSPIEHGRCVIWVLMTFFVQEQMWWESFTESKDIRRSCFMLFHYVLCIFEFALGVYWENHSSVSLRLCQTSMPMCSARLFNFCWCQQIGFCMPRCCKEQLSEEEMREKFTT